MTTNYTMDDLYCLEDSWHSQRTDSLGQGHEACMPVGSQGTRNRSRKRASAGVSTKRRGRRKFNKYERC